MASVNVHPPHYKNIFWLVSTYTGNAIYVKKEHQTTPEVTLKKMFKMLN